MHFSGFDILKTFSFFLRREMTCFAVVWTTWAYDDKCSVLSYFVPSAGSRLRIVRTHFSSIMTLNNLEMIAETRSYILRWRSRFRRRRVCLPIVYGHFFVTCLCLYLDQGLNLANFSRAGLKMCFVTPEQKFFYGQLFIPWLCQVCIESKGLVSLNFSRPGLVTMFFWGSRVESLFCGQFFLPDFVERVLEPRGFFA